MLNFERNQVLYNRLNALSIAKTADWKILDSTYDTSDVDLFMRLDDVKLQRRRESGSTSGAGLKQISGSQGKGSDDCKRSSKGIFPPTHSREPLVKNRKRLQVAVDRHCFLNPLLPGQYTQIVDAHHGYDKSSQHCGSTERKEVDIPSA